MTVRLGFRLMYFSDSPIMEKGLEKQQRLVAELWNKSLMHSNFILLLHSQNCNEYSPLPRVVFLWAYLLLFLKISKEWVILAQFPQKKCKRERFTCKWFIKEFLPGDIEKQLEMKSNNVVFQWTPQLIHSLQGALEHKLHHRVCLGLWLSDSCS